MPLAHIMERLCLHLVTGEGGLSCFIPDPDMKTYLAKEIKLTRPTVLVAVPRVLKLFHESITKKLNDGVLKEDGCKKSLYLRGYNAKLENLKNSGQLTHSIYDKLIFSKITNEFGGRLMYFITGSAPLP